MNEWMSEWMDEVIDSMNDWENGCFVKHFPCVMITKMK